MSGRIFLQITAPALLVGVVLCGACVAAVWALGRLQANQAAILSENVSSLQAARRLQIELRLLRFHTLLCAMDPNPDRRRLIDEDLSGFEAALAAARLAISVPEEGPIVEEIAATFAAFRSDLAPAAFPPPESSTAEFVRWSDAHPVRKLSDRCEELARLNETAMRHTAHESEALARRTEVALWVLGLAGPLGGLIGGFGVARGLSRSVAQLSVRLNDLHSELDQQVGSVRLAAGGDLNALDRQLDRVVARVHGVVEQLQLREREALRAEQLAAVGRLAAGMAHNIRNPLTAVKLLISAAIKGGPGRELTPEDLRVIHGEVTRLEQTVEGLLDLARPSPERREPGDLREAVTHALDLVRARADNQGVTVEATLPAGPVPAAWDRGTLGMALLNLLWNALDSMPDGGRLRVSLEHGGSALRVQVRDTGPGISAEVRDRLFTPFASTKSGGTGLGLATCRRVVEQHGGTVEGHDDPAGGAVFTVTLPAGES